MAIMSGGGGGTKVKCVSGRYRKMLKIRFLVIRCGSEER